MHSIARRQTEGVRKHYGGTIVVGRDLLEV